MKNEIKKQIYVLPDVVKLLSGQVVTFIFHCSIAPIIPMSGRIKNYTGQKIRLVFNLRSKAKALRP